MREIAELFKIIIVAVIVTIISIIFGFAVYINDVKKEYNTKIELLNDSIKYYKIELNSAQDIIFDYKNDTVITSEEFVLKYKLERIKYYNDIAKKGNNIKYLRGWINRVLNE